MQELLFRQRGHLRDALVTRLAELQREVERVPEEHLLQADAEEWAEALAESYAIACPVLQRDQMYRDKPQDTQIDLSGDPGRDFSSLAYARAFPGYRVTVHVPFVGEEDVFDFMPSEYTLNPPRAAVRENQLLKHIDYARDVEPNLDGTMDEFLNTVERWLGFARKEIEPFNARLQRDALAAIAERRARLERRDAGLASSAIPEGPPDQQKTQIVEAVVRRPAPRLSQARGERQAIALEPTLAEQVYEHILDLVRIHGLQMEQSPASYLQLDEETLRDTILGMLNTHYEGRMAAEAFNGAGHTDIILRYESHNLFIGECKIWSGASDFAAAIDQLFGYRGWRDTKLALIVFVRQKRLSTIIEKARDALRQHPQFVEERIGRSETEFRARVSWPGDPARHADLNVTFIHTPA